jgi:type II secretory pathway component PulC
MVSAQEGAIDLGSALRKLAEDQASRQSAPSVDSPAGPSPSTTAAVTDRFVLLGVVISDNRRLALLQPTKTPGAGTLVRLGDSFEDHRLLDVQTDHVTLEGRGGERIIVRLAAGHAGVAAAPASRADTQLEGRSRAAKEARQRGIDEATARDKVRALAERFQLKTMPPPTSP